MMRYFLFLFAFLFFITQYAALSAQPPKEITTSIGLKMVWIPPGSFQMGSPTKEKGRDADETPHDVVLTKGYYLGVFEVTREQYKKVMGKLPENPNQPDEKTPDNTPITDITWDEAVAFCTILTELLEEKKAGRIFRLPTEAEWEYACRAGTRTAFSFGDDANKSRDSISLEKLDVFGRFQLPPVGQKKPNAWGLFDMHGGVAEWCADWFGPYHSGRISDPKGPSTGTFRVNRGGGYYQTGDPSDLQYNRDDQDKVFSGFRSAFRFGHIPEARRQYVGFRVALTSPGPP